MGPRTIQLIVLGIMPLTANGRLELLKEPPFRVLTPGWAALATVDVERDIPHITDVFDLMAAYPREHSPIIAGETGRWITGEMYCIGREAIRRGVRYKLAAARYAWSHPCRLGDVRTPPHVRDRLAA
jgi:hypothetical protein